MKFDYEDTDRKIEVELYGIVFEINKEVIVNKDINGLRGSSEINVESEIEDILGKGSIDKLNDKRVFDGYDKMTLDVEIAVLTCIYKAYITATSGNMVNEIINTNRDLENKAIGVNRFDRRCYNGNQFRGRRNYRRY